MSYWWSLPIRSLTKLLMSSCFVVSVSGARISTELGMKSKQKLRSAWRSLKSISVSVNVVQSGCCSIFFAGNISSFVMASSLRVFILSMSDRMTVLTWASGLPMTSMMMRVLMSVMFFSRRGRCSG